MSRKRRPRGLKVDPDVKAAQKIADPWDPEGETLRLRSILDNIAHQVGARSVVIGKEGQLKTLIEIQRRLEEYQLFQENMHWREFAWLSCPHLAAAKYGDDGEMQCQGADFRRGKIEDLSEHLRVARRPDVVPQEVQVPLPFPDGV